MPLLLKKLNAMDNYITNVRNPHMSDGTTVTSFTA